MALPGETVDCGAPDRCEDCGSDLVTPIYEFRPRLLRRLRERSTLCTPMEARWK